MDNAFIANGTLDAAKIKDATITSAKIGQAEIKTVNIAQAAIKSAQIDDLAVTSGKIANLAVDTLQIAGNAVTLPVASSNNNDVTLKYRTYQQVLSVSIPVSGSCSLVFTTYHRGQVNDTNNASLNVRAVFNGEIVASGTISNVTSSMGRFSFGQSAVFARMFDAKATGTLIIEAEGEDNGYIQNSYLMATILRR